MSISNSTICHNNSTRHADIIPVCVYSFIFVVGLIFNLISLAFLFSNNKSISQTIIYMTNLAIADLLLIFTLPVRIYYHLGFMGLSQWVCDGVGLILKANMYGSIFLLTCICADRCMAVSFPMSPSVQKAREKARWFCLGIWILTFGASLPIYFSKRRQILSMDCFDALPVYSIELGVIVPTLLLGFGIPLVTMLVCSWGLLYTVQQSTVSKSGLVDSRKILRMIATSLLIFLLSFLPYHATLVVLYLNRDQIPCSMVTAHRYSLMVACLNTVLDPVVYYFTTDTFRRKMDFRAIWKIFFLNSQSSDMNLRSRVPNSIEKD